ncbi:MAG: class I SAM-dependent methyltransferase [Akkermansiaceae bacterium]|nr:class I SAM-dependent methyltransferase [Akkermansiaceae bacterium]
MKESRRIAKRIASHCSGLWLPNYTSSKLSTDPLYDGVYEEIKSSTLPLLDVGCGLGILGMYLRERGWRNHVTGFDFDAGKIKGGQRMIQKGNYKHITLSQGDARTDLPKHHGDVTILDILQFFDDSQKKELLNGIAKRVAPGGKLIIRSGLHEKNLRFYTTIAADFFAKITFWMKSAPIHYPTAEFFCTTLKAEGLEVSIRPFWGKTPFNNYLIVAKRPV